METWREISTDCSLLELERKRVLHVLGVVQGPETQKLKPRRQLDGGAKVLKDLFNECVFLNIQNVLFFSGKLGAV